jgi:2-polyprenyl-6-methoxyphenol hydroxylase-like FAD-dependent oxidoreductase
VRFDPGPVVLRGRFPEFEGASAVYSPRRTILDKLLVDAARAAGAEVRERFAVDELVFDGGRVTGVRGREGSARAVTETARLVVGADGRHSAVAKAVEAPAYHVKPALSTAYYTYWSGVGLGGGEIYSRTCLGRMVGAWPTNDGLVMTYVAAPASAFDVFRADPEAAILAALDACGDLGERVRAGERADRVFGTADTQNRFHKPHGPGWALVGDAGLVMDPVTGAGIADALRDAELLADAVAAGLNGGPPLDTMLAGYQAARDAAALPMYEMTTDLASFAPPRPEQEMLLRALEGDQREIDRFLSVLTGSLPIPEYFTPRNMLRLIGVRGVWQAMRSQRKMRA